MPIPKLSVYIRVQHVCARVILFQLFQKRAAMGIMLGHPISNDLVDVIMYEVGMMVALSIYWGFKVADCNYH